MRKSTNTSYSIIIVLNLHYLSLHTCQPTINRHILEQFNISITQL
jgi:hypothetical protein